MAIPKEDCVTVSSFDVNDYIFDKTLPLTTGPFADSGSIDNWSSQNSTTLNVTDGMLLCFDDGTKISGKDLSRYFKLLQRIVENDYPEELF